MQLHLVLTPDHVDEALQLTPYLAHAAFRAGEDGALLTRPLPPTLRGGFLVLHCPQAFPAEAAGTLVCQLIHQCIERRFSGVILDADNPLPCLSPLIAQLAELCRRHARRLYVPECCATFSQEAAILLCTALSGGSLQQRLAQAVAQHGAQRIALDLQRLMMDFPLPCPGGEGVPLTQQALHQLQRGHSSYYCDALCAHYFTYRRGSETRFVLYDGADTLRRKMELAAALGITEAFVMWPETEDLLAQLFGEKKKGEP